MKLTTILESKQQLVEQHRRKGLITLVESCQGLDKDQTRIVEGIYKELRPLIEASMSPEQIKQLFGEVEKGATAAGGNRTTIGKSKDVVDKVNKIINDAGKWLQDTTPVKNFDAKFEKLKNDINKKFPDSKILDGISNMAIWAKENPGKTAAIVGILTAIASLAAGPIGGAIAGQVLRGSVELLKGEKLSTAIGKGVKTAVFGYLSGKAFEMLGKFAETLAIKQIPFGPEDAGFEEITIGGFQKTISSPGMEWVRTIPEVDVIVDPEMASAIRSAHNMLRMGGDAASEGFEQLSEIAKIINSSEYRQNIIDTLEVTRQELIKNDSLTQFVNAAKEALQSASQGAVAAAGVAADGKEKKESISRQSKKLSEGQIYMLFNRVDVAQDFLAEAGFLSKVGDKIKGAAGAVGKKLATVGSNLTNKVTADKLNSAWQKAGSPTDSDDVYNVLTQAGVDPAVIAPVFDTMKLPVPKAAAQAWDKPEGDQPAQGAAQGGAAPAATPAGQPVSNLATGDQPAQGAAPAAQGGAAPAAAPASGPVDVVALAAEIKAVQPNIVADVKTMLDADPSAKKKAAPKAAPVAPATTPTA